MVAAEWIALAVDECVRIDRVGWQVYAEANEAAAAGGHNPFQSSPTFHRRDLPAVYGLAYRLRCGLEFFQGELYRFLYRLGDSRSELAHEAKTLSTREHRHHE
jgi:hypothetical protein